MSARECPSCGASVALNETECKYCGEALAVQPQQYQAPQPPQQPQYQTYPRYEAPSIPLTNKNKTAAAVLAILLGSFGAHKFYLGRVGKGILYFLFCWTYIPGIIGIIEGIKYIKADEIEFYNKYVRK